MGAADAPLRPLTRAAAALCAGLALVSAGLSAPRTWSDLAEARERYDDLTDREVAVAPAVHERLPVAVFDLYRARIRPDDRYYFNAPRGERVGLVDERTVALTFATYWLLPALPVKDRSAATVVLRYDPENPREAAVERLR